MLRKVYPSRLPRDNADSRVKERKVEDLNLKSSKEKGMGGALVAFAALI